MLCWAFKANFTNLSRRTTQAISFHDMTAESAGNEMKSVNHVHAHCVTNLPAPCREEAICSPLLNSTVGSPPLPPGRREFREGSRLFALDSFAIGPKRFASYAA